MALVGFPNQIEVTIGGGWVSGLTPDDVIVLTPVGGGAYTENGTNTPSGSNRLKVTFEDGGGIRAGIGFYGTFTFYNRGYARAATSGNYPFLDMWDGTLPVTTQSWSTGFFASGTDYNPDVFSLMREYAPSASGNPHYAYAQQQ